MDKIFQEEAQKWAPNNLEAREDFLQGCTVADPIGFLDHIRAYERESGNSICNDDRTSEQLYEIFKTQKL